MQIVIHLLLMLFPWCVRRALLCFFFKYKIHPSARIGFSFVMPKRLEMGPGCCIGHLTTCKWSVDALIMKEFCAIGSSVMITGISTSDRTHFGHIKDRHCELVLERGVGIPSRKFFDCNGGIYIGEYTTVAGQWTQFLTHSIDIYNSRQDAKPIHIGKYCFIGTGCILLPGSRLPDYSVLGAGSILNKQYVETGCLYAGAPAVAKKKLNPEQVPWMQRTTQGVL